MNRTTALVASSLLCRCAGAALEACGSGSAAAPLHGAGLLQIHASKKGLVSAAGDEMTVDLNWKTAMRDGDNDCACASFQEEAVDAIGSSPLIPRCMYGCSCLCLDPEKKCYLAFCAACTECGGSSTYEPPMYTTAPATTTPPLHTDPQPSSTTPPLHTDPNPSSTTPPLHTDPQPSSTTPPTPETTTTTTIGRLGSCTLMGDPHITTFDGGIAGTKRFDFYLFGDYWLVKSVPILIQGRYGSAHPKTGNSMLAAIALGGPFLNHETLIVDPNSAIWSGSKILTSATSFEEPTGLFSAAMAGKRLTFMLPMEVTLVVTRFAKHLTAVIGMRQLGDGQDGHCGNFNLDATDDTSAKLKERWGTRVPDEELLFLTPDPLRDEPQPPVRTLEDCAQRDSAIATCKEALGDASEDQLRFCAMDICFGGPEFANDWVESLKQEDGGCKESWHCSAGGGTALRVFEALAGARSDLLATSMDQCKELCREVILKQSLADRSCCVFNAAAGDEADVCVLYPPGYTDSNATSSPAVCHPLSKTQGRCGATFGGRCDRVSRWGKPIPYCNERSGWCGPGAAHKNAQESDEYDWAPASGVCSQACFLGAAR